MKIELDRRELASIRAALKLLLQVAGPGSRDYVACRLVDAISSENDTIEPLAAAEIAELVRRLEYAAGTAEAAGAVEEAKAQA